MTDFRSIDAATGQPVGSPLRSWPGRCRDAACAPAERRSTSIAPPAARSAPPSSTRSVPRSWRSVTT